MGRTLRHPWHLLPTAVRALGSRANTPSQAVLIDFPNRRSYCFLVEIWPQKIYYLTGLLIVAAMALFLMNAVAGRLWCGYLCPQTVWTDLFITIERWTEGDRREHMLRDRRPWTLERAARTGAKHFLWLIVAWWTGGAWVLYSPTRRRWSGISQRSRRRSSPTCSSRS